MDKIKISSLGIFDEKKYKKLATDRSNWLNSGADMVVNSNYKINSMAKKLMANQSVVVVKNIIELNENYKMIELQNIKGDSLPIFKAGQKIALTIDIDGNYFNRPFNIASSPSKSYDGEYSIVINSNSSDFVLDYLYNNIMINDKFVVSNPFGDFYYNPLRDEKNVIAIVSDEGIILVYSMINSILDGTENYNLSLFYSEKYEKDLLFKDELQRISENSNKINVDFVLSAEQKDGYLTGFVSTSKIKQRYGDGYTSFFISGSEGLLKYLDNELKEFKLPKKFVRYDSFLPRCNIKRVVKYKLSIFINDEKYDVPCYNNKTIMKAIEEGGIYIPSKCQNGSCGFCRSELVKGEVKIVNDKRVSADKKYNYIHPCSTYPLSDIEIIVR